MNPLISVIIPVYNCEKYLKRAYDSIVKQNYPNLEIIIVDDGSTDGSARIAKNLNSIYLYQKNQGPAAARNLGIKYSKGDYLGFLDSDDEWPQDTIKIQLKSFIHHQNIDVSMGSVMVFNDNKAVDLITHSSSFGCAFFKRSIFEKVGLLDVNMCHSEDVDWFLRAKEKGCQLYIHEETTLKYHRHRQNMTLDVEENHKYLLKALKKSLDRRRKSCQLA